MLDLILRDWNGKTIRQREDGFLSATDMCDACGKLFGNWNKLNSTKEYLKALQEEHYSDQNNASIVESNVGGMPEFTGTWLHELAALELARWLSPKFAIQCNKWIRELITKGYVINQQATSTQLEAALTEIEDLKSSRELAELKAFQMSSYIDNDLKNHKVDLKVQYECYTDGVDGNPIVFVEIHSGCK